MNGPPHEFAEWEASLLDPREILFEYPYTEWIA